MTPETETSPPVSRWRPTALEWTCLVAGLFFCLHYAWVLDDAFVYYRYIDNLLVLGHGLVYNQGEYVEGFTSPLWLLLLTLLRLTTADYWLLVRLFAVASFATFWWMLVILNRALSPRDSPRASFPLIALSVNYAVACYFTSGVETPLVQVAAVAYALFVARPNRSGPALVVALSPLIRPELTLTFGIVVAWAWFRARRACLRLILVGGSSLGLWLLFRIYNYADLLPNAFYLKDLADIGQGWTYLHETLSAYWVYPILLVFAGCAVFLRRRGVDIDLEKRLLMLGLAAIIAAYFVRIGGDGRHYRYLAFSFCLALASLSGLTEHALHILSPRVLPTVLFGSGLVVAVLLGSLHPPQLVSHPLWGKVEHRKVSKINDAAYHRYHPDLAASPWQLSARFDLRAAYTEHELISARREPYREVIVDDWCVRAYYRFRSRVVHHFGLTDAILARTEAKPHRPGHKYCLGPLARDLAAIQARYSPGRGMYRRAIADGRAPSWIAHNLEAIEVIEKKIYNEHDFLENLRLAFTFLPGLRR